MKHMTNLDVVTPERVDFPASFLGPILNEGLLKGSCISLVGPPGVGKTVFCESLANSFVQNDMCCLYLTTDRSPADIRNDFRRFGTRVSDLEHNRRVVFVDGYGWLSGDSNETFRAESLVNLPELIILIERASQYLDGRVLFVLDSVSPLPLYNPEIDVVKFLQSLSARIKNRMDLGIYVVQGLVHSEKFYHALAYLVDGTFDMKVEEEDGRIQRYFRISNLRFMAHETNWAPFVIEKDGGFRLQTLESY